MAKDPGSWTFQTHILPYTAQQPWTKNMKRNLPQPPTYNEEKVKVNTDLIKDVQLNEDAVLLAAEQYDDASEQAESNDSQSRNYDNLEDNPWADESYYGSPSPVAGSLPFQSGAIDGFVNDVDIF